MARPHRRHGGRQVRIGRRSAITVAAATIVAIIGAACVPPPATPAPTPVPTPVATPTSAVPPGWTEHEIGSTGIVAALPGGWIGFDEAALRDPAIRAELEREFAGARSLFASVGTGERSARVIYIAVDGRSRGTGAFAPNIAFVAVEPPVPRFLLDLGADFALTALEATFAIESDVGRGRLDTPIGPAARLEFEHRVVLEPGGPGVRVTHDGALVTTGDTSMLVSLNNDRSRPAAGTPSLAEVLGHLRLAASR